MASLARSLCSCLRDWSIAASRREVWAVMSAAWILWRTTPDGASEAPNIGRMATPAETEMPCSRRSGRSGAVWLMSHCADRIGLSSRWSGPSASVLFIEPCLDQCGEGIHGFLGIPTFAAQLDAGTAAGAQHHQAHDRAGRHRLAVLQHLDGGAVAVGQGDDLGGGAGMQPTLVADRQAAGEDCGAGGSVSALLRHGIGAAHPAPTLIC